MTGKPPSALRLIDLHVRTLFTHDGRDRLGAVNDADAAPPPRFFLGRTEEGCLWRFGEGLPDDVVEALERLCRAEPPVDADGERWPVGRDGYVAILASHRDVEKEWAGPCYGRGEDRGSGDSGSARHEVRRIEESNRDLLTSHLADWQDIALEWQPMTVALRDGSAVSVCASVRRTPGAHEAGVETHPDHRRNGFAHSAVAAWLAELEPLGVEPLYSTSWDNEGSQRLADSLGLDMFGIDFYIT